MLKTTKLRKCGRRLLGIAALLSVAIAAVMAQQAAGRGTVSGMVLRGGAPVPGTPVLLASNVSNFKAKTNTNKTGNFSFSDVPIGTLTVSALDPDGKALGTNSGELKAPNDSITVTVVIH